MKRIFFEYLNVMVVDVSEGDVEVDFLHFHLLHIRRCCDLVEVGKTRVLNVLSVRFPVSLLRLMLN